jgi:hypothetical protein
MPPRVSPGAPRRNATFARKAPSGYTKRVLRRKGPIEVRGWIEKKADSLHFRTCAFTERAIGGSNHWFRQLPVKR